jgi:hypothetical protein
MPTLVGRRLPHMIQGLNKVLSVLAGLLLLAILVAGGGALIYVGVTNSPTVTAAITAGVATVVAIFVQRRQDRQREAEKERRDRLTPLYERLIEIVVSVTKEETSEEELEKFFYELAQRLMLWAPETVIAAYEAWRRKLGDSDALVQVLALEDLILVLRADLGAKDKAFGEGRLVRLFINDIDEHIAARAASSPDT